MLQVKQMIAYLNLIKNVTEEDQSRKKYGKQLRLELVEKAKKIGNLKLAAKELGVPYKTLYNWINTRKL